jgi:hypothetical protein
MLFEASIFFYRYRIKPKFGKLPIWLNRNVGGFALMGTKKDETVGRT